MPSAYDPPEVSQRTRVEVRWDGVAAALFALPVPACVLEPAGAPLPNGQQTGHGGPRLVLTNAALDRLLNYEPGALQGCPFSQIWPERLAGRTRFGEQPIEGQEGHACRRDGAQVPVRLTLRPCLTVPDPRQARDRPFVAAAEALVCTLEDLRPLRELQARLLSAERLMSQGALVAGVAHEVNNPASLLLANLQELQRAFGQLLPLPIADNPSHGSSLSAGLSSSLSAALSPSLSAGPAGGQDRLHAILEVHSILADATEGVQRIVEVVRDLLQLSRSDAAPAETINLNRLIETVLRLARPMLSGTYVQRSLGVLPPIRAQRPRLFQVVLNLLINAVHAVAEVDPARRTILLRTQSCPKGHRPGVRLEIEDQGCGMSKAVLDRIFEPFFTTKEAGRGTGLGLALALAILEQHGGSIQVRSTLGQGTHVQVWLPCEPPFPPGQPASPALDISLLPRRA